MAVFSSERLRNFVVSFVPANETKPVVVNRQAYTAYHAKDAVYNFYKDQQPDRKEFKVISR